ncbi:MAG: periplasmic heavy metal sensor [Candidatus Marinimicrobia bacterium]|nr:periplasmic heavy metal sensor [Candidatus Neomarinimicrobiota bacterium]
MYKKTKHFILPILLLGLTMPAFAQMGSSGQGYGAGKTNKFQELQLTSEQEEQMQNLRYDFEKLKVGLDANLKTERLDLKKLERDNEPNKKKIHAQIEKVGEQRIALEKAKADHHLEIRKVLTDDQYKIFMKKMKTQAGRKGHGGKGKSGHFDEGRKAFRK